MMKHILILGFENCNFIKQVVKHYFLSDPTIRTREVICRGSHERTWRGEYAFVVSKE